MIVYTIFIDCCLMFLFPSISSLSVSLLVSMTYGLAVYIKLVSSSYYVDLIRAICFHEFFYTCTVTVCSIFVLPTSHTQI